MVSRPPGHAAGAPERLPSGALLDVAAALTVVAVLWAAGWRPARAGVMGAELVVMAEVAALVAVAFAVAMVARVAVMTVVRRVALRRGHRRLVDPVAGPAGERPAQGHLTTKW